ncbi:MAG TPA: zinc-binding dehydrogenase [Gemmatimonadales bacterium]|nr:zinc-binding dehydrogenase [Gemmatimonadales bacterium]
MRALALDAVGGLQHLAVRELPSPEIVHPDDARIRMRAAALNRLDLFVADGLPGVNYVFPHIVGSDGAGIVDEVGPAVTAVRPGDRVMINPGLSCGRCAACAEGDAPLCASFRVVGEHRPGTAAEYLVVPAANLAPVPPRMPWAEAAAFSLATLTAWRMLTTRARLAAGETVLIWGIGGGVALAALQIVRHLGAHAIVTSGSDTKLEAARRYGAGATINHATTDVVAEVRRLTDGRGAHVIVDSVGQTRWQDSLRALRRGGRLVICGATTGPMIALDLRRLFWHQWSILGSTLGSRREYDEIVALAHEGRLWPVVDGVVPLEEGPSALARLQRGEQLGKLVIEVAT